MALRRMVASISAARRFSFTGSASVVAILVSTLTSTECSKAGSLSSAW